MTYLRRLSLSLTFVCVLSAAAFAGETGTPPCAPGELQSPPCPGQSVNDGSSLPGETESPSAAPLVEMTDLTEAVMWALSLF